MRTLILSLMLACTALLSACPGSTVQALPEGSGQGKYIGQFLDDTSALTLGTFKLTIDNTGAMEGDGTLNGRDMKLVGYYDTVTLEGWISDDLTGRTGEFDGHFEGNTLLGSYELEGPDGSPLEGFWDAGPDN